MEVKDVIRVTRDICLGLKEIHALSIPHLGINPHNVLMNMTTASGLPSVTLSDVNMNHILLAAYRSIGRVVLNGTFNFMAPEQFDANQNHGPKCDLWALACMVIYMVTGDPPMPGASVIQICKEVGVARRPRVRSHHQDQEY